MPPPPPNRWPDRTKSNIENRFDTGSSIARIRRLNSDRLLSSVTPKTARAITSSVIACIEGRSEKVSPTGQESIASSVADWITDS